MKDSAILYGSFYRGVQILPAEQKAEAYDAYFELAAYGKEYEGKSLAVAVLLKSISDKLEEADRKYQKKSEVMLRNRMKSQDITKNDMKSQDISSYSYTYSSKEKEYKKKKAAEREAKKGVERGSDYDEILIGGHVFVK